MGIGKYRRALPGTRQRGRPLHDEILLSDEWPLPPAHFHAIRDLGRAREAMACVPMPT